MGFLKLLRGALSSVEAHHRKVASTQTWPLAAKHNLKTSDERLSMALPLPLLTTVKKKKKNIKYGKHYSKNPIIPLPGKEEKGISGRNVK